MRGDCFIYGAGEIVAPYYKPKNGDLVIAADAGYDYLLQSGIKADLAVGDFDSLGHTPTSGVETEVHPVMKDDTDTELAVKKGFEKGFSRFFIYGGTGGRLDHTLANIQVLSYIAQNGGMGFLFGEDYTITAVICGTLEFCAEYRGTVSVFALCGKAAGVNLTGLKYPLEEATLTGYDPIGVSNEFTGSSSQIEVKDGCIAVIWQKNRECELPKLVL